MTIRNDVFSKSAWAKSIRRKGIFLALALAGAAFQACTTEDKATSPVGTGPGADATEAASSGDVDYAVHDGFASLPVDSVQQARDEKMVGHKSGSWEDMVVTPFGKVARHCVYELGEGESIKDENTVVTKTGQLKFLDGTGCGSPGPTGSALAKTEKALTRVPTNGWVMAGWDDMNYNGGELVSDFTVPQDPVSGGSEILFFFSSFQSEGKDGWIVQSVLEWGNNLEYGGHYWVMGGWIVKGSGSVRYHSKPVVVFAGDRLRGTLLGHRCTYEGRCKWSVDIKDLTTRTSSHLASDLRLPTMVTAQGGVLEAYDVQSCSDYPAQTHLDFTHIQIWDDLGEQMTSSWDPRVVPNLFPDCGFKVTVRQDISSGVGLHWNPNL